MNYCKIGNLTRILSAALPIAGGGLACLLLAASALLSGPAVGANSGYRVYVTNEGSGDLSVIDGGSNAVVGRWPLGKRPRGIAAAADGKRLYVAMSGSPLAGPGVDESRLPPPDKTADGIGVIELSSGRLQRLLPGVSDPEQLAVGHDGTRLYVASEDTGKAVIMRVPDGAIPGEVGVGGEPEGVAVSERAGLIGFTSETASTVARLDARSARLLGTIAVGQRPRDLAFTPDGARLFVTSENGSGVTVIDVQSRKPLRTIHLAGQGARPKGLALSADGARVYVATGRGAHVVALDALSLEVIGEVQVS